MAQYTERFQFADLLGYEYDSLFECFFEVYVHACDYYYLNNDGTYTVTTIRCTEVLRTLEWQEEAQEDCLYEEIEDARLCAADYLPDVPLPF